MLEPAAELELGVWRVCWMAKGQPVDFKFVPLHEIDDEIYTIYSPVMKTSLT